MKKIFAMFAVAALAFAVGCGPETKTPVKVNKSGGETKVETNVPAGDKAEVKVDEKGNVDAKIEKEPVETTTPDTKHAAEGDKPAAEGDKPAAEGDKPAAEGDKPAAEGDKPAADAKPEGDKKEEADKKDEGK